MGIYTNTFEDNSQSRFAYESEIKQLPMVDHKKKTCSGGGVIIKSDGITSYVDNSDRNTMVVGTTGSKKTRNIILPSIISSIISGDTMIINAMKDDVIDYTYDMLKKNGYNIIFLNFRNPDQSECFNVLSEIEEIYRFGQEDTAIQMMKSLFENLFSAVESKTDALWSRQSAAYAVGLGIIILDEYPEGSLSIDNIYNLHMQISRDDTLLIEYIDLKRNKTQAYKQIYPVLASEGGTKASYYSVFSAGLAPYVVSDSIIKMTSYSSFQVSDIVDEKTAIFIMNNEFNTAYYPLISCTIDMIYSSLGLISEQQGGLISRETGEKRRVRFIIDEFGSMTSINHFSEKISLSRGRGISWLLVCQSLDQLELRYEKCAARNIITNCDNICYLHTPDDELLKIISERCGEVYDEEKCKDVPLCSKDLLRHLDKEKGECLWILGSMYPYITHLPDISEYYGIVETKQSYVQTRKRKSKQIKDFDEILLNLRMKRKMEKQRRKEKREIFRLECEEDDKPFT